ncbi:MFS transporter [Streptomyces sp. NPDC054784]
MATPTPSGVHEAGAARPESISGAGPASGSASAPSAGSSGSGPNGSGHGGKHAAHAASGGHAPMTHKQIMEALSGLLLGMFVAILSSTIVSTALPEIISDLDGSQSSYTWVVTATLLTMTASTPLWGKLADLTSKKMLVQLALVIFVLASAGAGLAQNTATLIGFRAVQGIGMGGLTALAQIIMAAMISPRERGRYSGYLGATFAVATVGGPLLGGVITDTEWLGWRWCFYAGVPFAVLALTVLQKTLHLPVVKRQGVKIDWLGAFVFAAAVSTLLIWVTLAGDEYDWMSWQTYSMVGGAFVLALLFVFIETKAKEPIVPLRLFRNRTITLASLGSLFVGVAMFGATVFLSQYFQLARGKSPTMSGLMTIPLIAGLFVSSTVSGQIITRTGRWKAWLTAGGVLLTAGLGLLGTMRYDTPYWHVAVFMALLGLGVGMMMQNLVLCTQNQVDVSDLGAASSVVAFFRSLGGAVGVSALGAVLGHRITEYTREGFVDAGIDPRAAMGGGGGGSIPDVGSLKEPVRSIIESAYGHGIGDVYLYSAPIAFLALVMVVFIKEVPLQTKSAMEQGRPDADGADAPVGADKQTDRQADGHGAPYGDQAPAADPEPAALAVEVPPATAFTPADPAGDAVADPAPAPVGGGVAVRGTVRDATGEPLVRATVTLISLSGRQLARSVAHTDGLFALDAPAVGSYVLIAAADGFQPQATTVLVGEGGLAHDVLLTGTSGLSGVVRGTADGKPVADAMVVVTDVRGEVVATGKTAERGDFAFQELVTGAYTVAVNADGHRPAARPVEVGGQGVTRVEVALRPAARVRGTVRGGGDRRPLPDARVTLVDADGNVVTSATTDDDGHYAFTDLDAGEYTVVASGYPPVAGALTVDGHGVDGHDVELGHPEV